MNISDKIKKLFKSEKGIKKEINDLKRKILIMDQRMYDVSQEFWRDGGICCEGCGIRHWHEWQDKQERRIKRLKELEDKLLRDTKNH